MTDRFPKAPKLFEVFMADRFPAKLRLGLRPATPEEMVEAARP